MTSARIVGCVVCACWVIACSGDDDDTTNGGGSGAMSSGGVSASGGSAFSGGSGGTANAGGTATGGMSGSTASGGSGGSGAGSDCGVITTFENDRAPLRELHVATSGSDASGDGSAALPFASIRRAANEATPGTAIRVHAGTYAGGTYLEDLAGTASAPIWIGGAPGEMRPVIAGGLEALHLSRARYVVVHDLEIRDQTGNGINADDGGDRDDPEAARHIVFRNLTIHDVGSGGNQDCLKLSGLNDYFVIDSDFTRCGGGTSGSAVDHVGCHRGLIARNRFQDLGGGNAIQNKGGSSDIEIRGNSIRAGGQRAVNLGGSTGFEFFRPSLSTTQPNSEASNIRVIANVMIGSVAALAFVGCVDCLATNNTIIDPENWIFRILQETTTTAEYEFLPAQNGRFVNNLIYFDRAALSTYVNVGAGTRPETFTLANNLWYAHDDPTASTPTGLPVTESNGVYAENPQFRDLGAGDYSIPPGSPAAGAGMAVPELTADFSGACWATTPSIGAFEAR